MTSNKGEQMLSNTKADTDWVPVNRSHSTKINPVLLPRILRSNEASFSTWHPWGVPLRKQPQTPGTLPNPCHMYSHYLLGTET